MAAKMSVVVVGIDDGPQSLAAFHRALKVFPKDSTHFLLAHVRPDHTQYRVDQVFFDNAYWTQLEAQKKELNTKVVEYFRRIAFEAGIKHNEAVLEGDAREQLCSFCAKHKADVLVLGEKAKNSLDGEIVDRVTQHCLHHAPCAVMVERLLAHSPEAK